MAENILLYFSDTGRGHRSATEAVEDALLHLAETEYADRDLKLIKEPVAEKSNFLNRFFVELYNYLLRKHQHLMKYYYGFLHWSKPNESKLAYLLSRDFLKKNLMEHTPSVVVSMHPMTNHYIYKAMQEVGLAGDVKLVVIITDPNKNLWKGWACHEAEVIVAPNELVKQQLMDWDVPEHKIAVHGMPVSPEFLKPPSISRDEFLTHLGLDPALPTLCINSGWAGGGNMLSALRSLKDLDAEIQVLFLCGHNQELYEKAKAEAAESKLKCAVLPFHDRMPDLMSAVDAMVTKAGGLTTFECVAKKLPMIVDVITEPMPQEAGTVEILVETGLAKKLEKPEQLPELVKDLLHDPHRMKKDLPAKYCLDQTHAIYGIARTILENGSAYGSKTKEKVERKSVQVND